MKQTENISMETVRCNIRNLSRAKVQGANHSCKLCRSYCITLQDHYTDGLRTITAWISDAADPMTNSVNGSSVIIQYDSVCFSSSSISSRWCECGRLHYGSWFITARHGTSADNNGAYLEKQRRENCNCFNIQAGPKIRSFLRRCRFLRCYKNKPKVLKWSPFVLESEIVSDYSIRRTNAKDEMSPWGSDVLYKSINVIIQAVSDSNLSRTSVDTLSVEPPWHFRFGQAASDTLK